MHQGPGLQAVLGPLAQVHQLALDRGNQHKRGTGWYERSHGTVVSP